MYGFHFIETLVRNNLVVSARSLSLIRRLIILKNAMLDISYEARGVLEIRFCRVYLLKMQGAIIMEIRKGNISGGSTDKFLTNSLDGPPK